MKKWIVYLNLFSLLLVSGTTFAAEQGASVQKNAHRTLVKRVQQTESLRVLFIGNSYSFHIPKLFAQLARNEGHTVDISQVTKGGWTLAKHAASQKILDTIAQGNWDIVVLQEQSLIPSFPEEQRIKMMDVAAKTLVLAIRKANAIPVFFLTWGRKNGDQQNADIFPSDTFAAMQQRLTRGYHQAAKATGGVWVVPVGEVWSSVRKSKKDSNLYAKDGSHPAAGGNYLGACVFYSAFYNKEVKNPSQTVIDARNLTKAAGSVRIKP